MTMRIALLIVALMTFTSAIQMVLNRHESRKLFVELQYLRSSGQQLDHEWGQLLLEQATWSTHARIEDIAHDKLAMVRPTTVYTLRQP